jgi:hypothetical protein
MEVSNQDALEVAWLCCGFVPLPCSLQRAHRVKTYAGTKDLDVFMAFAWAWGATHTSQTCAWYKVDASFDIQGEKALGIEIR